MLYWIADVAYRARDEELGPEHRLIRTCTYGMAAFLHVLDTSPDIMSHDQANAASKKAYMFALSYQQLAVRSFAAKVARWKVRPKGHYFLHMVDSMRRSR
eukprot:15072222-Alexandrium_andersonii.AAC.1